MPWGGRTWHGGSIRMRAHRAAGRGIVGIAVAISAETKAVTHKLSGTLARSTHAAPAGYEPSMNEEALAEGGDLGMHIPLPMETPLGPACEVGSWLPYACAEWVGRGHPGVTEGLERVRGPRAHGIMSQSFREEGL